MHFGIVSNHPGMEVSTIEIGNIDMPPASIVDSSCDVTKCALIVAMNRER